MYKYVSALGLRSIEGIHSAKREEKLLILVSKFGLKDDVHSVLRIGSAHNKAGSPDIKIV